jgi:hypothetical protein
VNYAGEFFYEEAATLVVRMEDAAGNAATGIPASGATSATVLYKREGETFTTLAAPAWTELGYGLYAVALPVAVAGILGALAFDVSSGTCKRFQAVGRVTNRNYSLAFSCAYDPVTSTLKAVAGVVVDGQYVSLSGRSVTLSVRLDGSSVVASGSATINNGFASWSISPVAFSNNCVYSVAVTVAATAVLPALVLVTGVAFYE